MIFERKEVILKLYVIETFNIKMLITNRMK